MSIFNSSDRNNYQGIGELADWRIGGFANWRIYGFTSDKSHRDVAKNAPDEWMKTWMR
ncbi:MAG: hypothetical protein K9J16_13330 [Melioribacteraceae bacterium]|nr:hypothetical protein [Melioribacteraceae bacterium]MCF8355304.1 hypothetical protein [Melioribacteraceae bacterium]MCF8396430.1 hypothetical protein [Melioribacteraceae bacterium]MCF8420382.1 hypothetical protein [Melioribacteraceae bacterium]